MNKELKKSLLFAIVIVSLLAVVVSSEIKKEKSKSDQSKGKNKEANSLLITEDEALKVFNNSFPHASASDFESFKYMTKNSELQNKGKVSKEDLEIFIENLVKRINNESQKFDSVTSFDQENQEEEELEEKKNLEKFYIDNPIYDERYNDQAEEMNSLNSLKENINQIHLNKDKKSDTDINRLVKYIAELIFQDVSQKYEGYVVIDDAINSYK